MPNEPKEIKIELTPDVARGLYSNFAVISHSPAEFVMDLVFVAPNTPQAQVQSRIIMTPENAKRLLHALQDNISRYEQTFGMIIPKEVIPGKNGVPPMNWPGGGQA